MSQSVLFIVVLLLVGSVKPDYSGNLIVKRLAFSRDTSELIAGFTTTPVGCKGDYFDFHIRVNGNNPMLSYIFEMLQNSYVNGQKVDIWYANNGQPAYQRKQQDCSVYKDMIVVNAVGYSSRP